MTQKEFQNIFDDYRMKIHKEGPFKKRTSNLHWGLTPWLNQEWNIELPGLAAKILRYTKLGRLK